MDHLETPYEQDVEFIECRICEKSIRGEALYKIHLTTPGHLKKEDSLLAQGALPGRPNIPKFRNISQYLDYLNLDEPIIGLSLLREIPSDGSQAGPKYACNLCMMTAFLPEMAHHLIGRKHRQKYVEGLRPDLVTWDTQSIMTQGGRVIRAKAEIIERQDGRGTPTPLEKTGHQGNFNNSRVPPRQRQNWDRTTEQIPQGQVAQLRPDSKNYQNKYPNQRKYPPNPQNTPRFQPEDPNMKRGRRHQWEDTASHIPTEDQPQRSQMFRDNFIGPDHYAQRGFSEDPPGRAAFGPGDWAPTHDLRETMPYGQAQHGEYYPEKETPYERSYSERGAPNEFYSEDLGREQILSLNYNPEGEKQHWPTELETSGHDHIQSNTYTTTYKAGRQEFFEPEAKRSTFSPSVNNEQAGNSYCLIRDYQHEPRPPLVEEANDYSSPDRAGTSAGQLRVGQAISDIPEPFRRFLSGGTDENHSKRKRKSRFSDATPEEMEKTKEIFNNVDRRPSPQFGGNPGAPPRHESSRMQYSDLYRGSEGPQYADSDQRGDSNSDDVFDVLKNIEIENEEQAKFLKSKLCGLLREFKSKKMEKETNSQNRAGSFGNYSDSKLEPQLPRHSLYERDTDHHEAAHNRHEQHQGYSHPPHAEPRHSGRGHYEGMFETAHGRHLDEPPYYPERFQEPLRSHDYQPAVKEFYGASPPMEQGSRMNRGPRHSNSLDKIASTLLELVSKK